MTYEYLHEAVVEVRCSAGNGTAVCVSAANYQDTTARYKVVTSIY
jgi:hypothetical protein